VFIDLTLGGALVEYLPSDSKGNQVRLEVPDKSTVAQVLTSLGVPANARMMVICDGNVVSPDEFVTTGLGPDAKLSVIPPIQAG